MYSRSIKSLSWAFCLALAVMIPAISSSQSSGKSGTGHNPSKWDIFTGFSYLAPKGNVTTPSPSGSSTITAGYKAINVGGLFSGAYFFNNHVGAQVEYGFHEWGKESGNGSPVGTHGNNDGFQTVGGGLIGRFQSDNITPFIHGLVGGALVNGPYFQGNKWGPQLTVGGGMDYELPWLDHRFAFRLFQADYQYTHVNFGPTYPGGRANINSARLSTGLVVHLGSQVPPPPVTLACSASPASVFPGEPVTVTATAGSLDPKLNAIYSWSGSGASGNGTSTTIQTSSLEPGNYTVKGDVKEGKAGKEGLKPGQAADCSSSFTVKAFEPPTISCTANPSTIKPGETATITSAGISPQNRTLTYSYSAASGTVTGTANTATFSSAGAPSGSVPITCGVSDDKGHQANAQTSVTIEAPPPPPPPAVSPEQQRLESRLALHSVFFPTDMPRTTNPSGGLVSSQEGTLTTLATDFKQYLQFKPDAKLTLVGHADARGSAEYNQSLSDRRVARTKQFLVEQGIAESSIETRGVGKEDNLSADQVKQLVNESTELGDSDKQKFLRNLSTIVWAQNRRVDIVLSTTGQQSIRQFPFNASDSLTLLSAKAPARSKAGAKKSK